MIADAWDRIVGALRVLWGSAGWYELHPYDDEIEAAEDDMRQGELESAYAAGYEDGAREAAKEIEAEWGWDE